MKIHLYTAVLFALLCFACGTMAGSAVDNTLAERWDEAYRKELDQAVAMYNGGDSISKPQTYELGRTYVLRQLHSRLDAELAQGQITPDEYDILVAVFNALIRCNPPGGCDLDCFQAIASKTPREDSSSFQPSRASVKEFLADVPVSEGDPAVEVEFLVGAPYTWEAFIKRLSLPDPTSAWQEEAALLARETNDVLIEAAQLFGASAEDFPGAVPPPVRVNFIAKLGTPDEPSPQDIVDSIKAYENYGEDYDIYGWRGIVQMFSDQDSAPENGAATLNDFAEFLKGNNILLGNADLGSHGDDPAETAAEKALDAFFTQISIFFIP